MSKTTELSKLLTSCLTAVKKHVIKYCEKVYERSGKNLFWSINNSGEFFCCTLLYVHSSIAIILMGKRELIALLNLSSWCLLMVERLFLPVPMGLSAVCDCGIS